MTLPVIGDSDKVPSSWFNEVRKRIQTGEITVEDFDAAIKSYAEADLPTATLARLAYATDGSKGLRLGDGTRWRKFGPVYDVRDSGIVGDGSTVNDAATIESLATLARDNNGAVWFPDGVHLFDERITLPSLSATDVTGYGFISSPGATLKQADGANIETELLRVQRFTGTLDVAVDGNIANNASGWAAGCVGVRFREAQNAAIRVKQVDCLTGSQIENNTEASDIAIHSTGCGDASMAAVRCDGAQGNTPDENRITVFSHGDDGRVFYAGDGNQSAVVKLYCENSAANPVAEFQQGVYLAEVFIRGGSVAGNRVLVNHTNSFVTFPSLRLNGGDRALQVSNCRQVSVLGGFINGTNSDGILHAPANGLGELYVAGVYFQSIGQHGINRGNGFLIGDPERQNAFETITGSNVSSDAQWIRHPQSVGAKRGTVTVRDALSPSDGDLYHNKTVSKLQHRSGGAWKDIHDTKAAHVADPSGGGTVDTEARAQLAAVIDALKAADLMEEDP